LESQARDDVGVSCQGWEGRDVERAHVRGVYVLAIWETDNDGLVGLAHIGRGGSSCEKVTCRARVEDGPCLYGGHVDIDFFEECS
jgi:hypothetical protein